MRGLGAFFSPLAPRLFPHRVKVRLVCSASAAKPFAPDALYVHLPFCKQKCSYCSFPVVVQREGGSTQTAEDQYLSLILAELDANAKAFAGRTRPLTTLYLGGGTPSLTSVAGIDRLLNAIDNSFGIAQGCEITCEMDPATFDLHKAKGYRECGITRASIGAQSFDDTLLEACRRVHREKDITDAVRWLRGAKFDNLSLDLISGLPGQSMATWKTTVEKAIGLQPEHISTYDLELDEGTPFGSAYRAGISPLPSEATAAEMLTTTSRMLRTSGYQHYEVSNYARGSSYQSRHNLKYWANEAFLACGLGATSLVAMDANSDAIRYARPRSMTKYAAYVREICREGKAERPDAASLFPGASPRSTEEALEDWLINSMRLLEKGVCFDGLRSEFGSAVASRVERACKQSGLIERGLIYLLYEPNHPASPKRMVITESGFIFESSILSTILSNAIWNYSQI